MKIQINKERLSEVVAMVSSMSKGGKTKPVLDNVLIAFDGSKLSLTASDGSKQITGRLDMDGLVGTERVKFCVDAKRLNSIIKAAPEQADIKIELKDSDCIIRFGRSRFKLTVLANPNDYPFLECNDIRSGYFIKPNDLKNQLMGCDYAMAKNDVRHYLNGLYIELDNGTVSYSASNGHVLARSIQSVKSKGEKTGVILANETVKAIEKNIGMFGESPVKVLFNHVTLKIDSDKYTLIANLVDGNFPDVTKVIPKNISQKAEFKASDLTDTINRASIVGSTSVFLDLKNDTAIFRTGDDDKDESVDEVDVKYQGEPLSIKINTAYLSGTLSSLKLCAPEHITLQFDGKLSPILVSGDNVADNRSHVVMPMRV